MFHKVLHGWMRFFDTTPSGRVLNRFSKDIDESRGHNSSVALLERSPMAAAADVALPFSLESFVQNFLMVLGYLIMIANVFPWFLVGCIPLVILFAILVTCFRAGIRSLKRSAVVMSKLARFVQFARH